LTLLWEIEPNFRYLCYKSEPGGNSPHGWFTSKGFAELVLNHAVLAEIQYDGTAAMDEMETWYSHYRSLGQNSPNYIVKERLRRIDSNHKL